MYSPQDVYKRQAITRAEEHCYLSFAKTRFRYGRMEFGSPSRFLRAIDVHYLQLPHEAGVNFKALFSRLIIICCRRKGSV